jgi:Uma2 family endonuclease
MMYPVTQSEIPQPLVLHFGRVVQQMSDDEFYDFCMKHPDLRIERDSEGDLIIMPPTGGETGRSNFKLTTHFGAWVESNGEGEGFDSSTEFILPNGAHRSPDVAWVRRERWEALTPEQRRKFPPLCPDFVVELRSDTDRLSMLKDKMREYIDNGAQLGWLIDPIEREVWVYRPNAKVERLDNPATISGDPELPGYVLPLDRVWR